MEKYRTVDEVAEILGISKKTVYKYTSNKTIPYIKIGSRVLFDDDDLLPKGIINIDTIENVWIQNWYLDAVATGKRPGFSFDRGMRCKTPNSIHVL